MKLEDQDFVISPYTGKKIDMKALLKQQQLAKIYINSNFPFFSELLRNLVFVYTFRVKTQATDGTRILVNPEFTESLSARMKAFVMMHEIMHCSLDHMRRGENHDHNTSNIAADEEVNNLLVDDGVVKPSDLEPYIYDTQYDRMGYETIYARQPKNSKGCPNKSSGQGQGQQGQGQQGQGQQGDKKETAGGKSGLSGKQKEEANGSDESCGGFVSQKTGAEIAKLEGYTGKDAEEKTADAIAREWQDAVIDACSHANGPGLGNIKTMLRSYYLTNHDWKNDLKKYVGRALSQVDQDTRIGKRKWLAQDEIKKYQREGSNAFDNIVFMIDCSGSVSDDLLQRLISECVTICKRKQIQKVTYCYYDDGIRQIETNDLKKTKGILNNVEVAKIRNKNGKPSTVIHGRGGNREGQALDDLTKLLQKNHRQLELLMWFTDGYTYDIPKKPKKFCKNMIWVVYDNHEFKASDDSRVIRINSKDLGK